MYKLQRDQTETSRQKGSYRKLQMRPAQSTPQALPLRSLQLRSQPWHRNLLLRRHKEVELVATILSEQELLNQETRLQMPMAGDKTHHKSQEHSWRKSNLHINEQKLI